ncbi:MAG: T9SS type A sorting domain-containing protein [Limnohabitans sp.]|nr:T9SS type A sorting domain-containing protein [Limnohabitans sp.]
MKNYLVGSLVFISFGVYSQSVSTDRNLQDAIESKTLKFEELSKKIEKSFEGKDIYAKGSGWKVYQRWKYISRFEIDENGYLPNSMDVEKSVDEFNKSILYNGNTFGKSFNNVWSPAGPFNYTNKGSWSTGQGRVNCSVTDPNNENIIYVGAANGGVWKSTDGGLNWSPITDFIDSLGISGLAIDPNNSNVIYAMTGDADGSNIQFNGLYKSLDAGATWTKMGLTGITYGRTVLVDPSNSNNVIVATNSGVYRSTNGGTLFTRTLNQGITYQISFNTVNSSIIYASTSNGTDSYIYKSTDNGVNWTLKNTLTATRKTLMATTKADSNYLYLLGANTSGALNGFKGIFISTDAGETFTARNNTTDILESGQSYYDLGFAVSQTNKDVLYTGCLNVWKSTDGGVTLTKQNAWNATTGPRYTHADIHSINTVGSNVYVGSDGGIYISKDDGATFVNKTPGLQISQFYKIDTSPTTNARLAGGLQDNGGFASNNDVWINFYGADGMDVAIDPGNPNLAYGMIQYGSSMYRYNFSTTANGAYVVGHSTQGEWVTPLEISSSSNIYAAWTEIKELVSGSWQAKTSNSSGYNIRNMKVNPLFPNRLLYYRKSAANSSFDELLYTAQNRDASGNLVPSVINLPTITGTSKTLSGICFNPVNPDIFYIIYNTRIYKTSDNGANWTDITFNFPSVTKYSIAAQGNAQNSVYVGTTFGVYYLDEVLNTWSLFSNGLPRTRVTDLKINTAENNLTIGTYGRGVWRVALPSESLAVEEFNSGSKIANVVPNPSNGLFRINFTINEPLKAAIYDMSGKLVFEKSFDSLTPNDTFDISNNAKGIYLLDIKSEKYTIRKKISIK